MHEQKFKDLLSSTCQVSEEIIVLDLESEVMRGPGSIPTGSNILSLDFFHIVKSSMPTLPMLCVCEKRKCLLNFMNNLSSWCLQAVKRSLYQQRLYRNFYCLDINFDILNF